MATRLERCSDTWLRVKDLLASGDFVAKTIVTSDLMADIGRHAGRCAGP